MPTTMVPPSYLWSLFMCPNCSVMGAEARCWRCGRFLKRELWRVWLPGQHSDTRLKDGWGILPDEPVPEQLLPESA